MKDKSKTNKAPQNAYALHNKLYCKRKSSTKSKSANQLVEAAKSWLSLSEEEKHIFYTKYKECESKFTKKIIDCLDKAEPFMKKKEPERTPELNTTTNSADNNNDIIEDHPQPQLDDTADNDQLQVLTHNEPTGDIDEETSAENLTSIQNIEPVTEEQLTANSHQGTSKTLCEPTPPSLKSGKELFEMLKSLSEKRDTTWISLSNTEKSRYNRAILTLKKDYIHKYTAYLDSLSSRELFDHYNKMCL